MKKAGTWMALFAILLWLLPGSAAAARLLVPGGQVVGLELQDGTVTVAAFDAVQGQAAQAAGLQIGDRIVKINDRKITAPEDVRAALDASDGTVAVTVERDGKTKALTLRPHITADGPRLGVCLRRGITGIGTVTWYDPDSGQFGALGHAVTGKGGIAKMIAGQIYPAAVASVRKGTAGNPGQLRGTLTAAAEIGSIDRNTAQGVFGRMDMLPVGEPLPTAEYSQIQPGPAVIRSTVSGNEIREYSVEILKIYPESRPDGRNLLLKVTDPALLEATGGIVQGMSGSPIIQNGKLVGAVTHVLVNDPTTGYGIFIDNMLDAAA